MHYQPPRPTAPSRQNPGPPWGEFLLSLFVPIAGVILGLLKAFHPDPWEKHKAGACFGGAVAGAVIGWLLLTVVMPTLVAGPGGSAYNRGTEAYEAGNLRLAETEYQTAVTTDPGLAIAWVNLAAAQLGQQNFPGAEASARRAVSLFQAGKPGQIPTPNNPKTVEALAHGNLAGALVGQLKMAEAAAEARQALAIDPSNPKAPNWQNIIALSGQ